MVKTGCNSAANITDTMKLSQLGVRRLPGALPARSGGKQQVLVLVLKTQKDTGRNWGAELRPTKLPRGFDVNVVVATAYSNNDP